jgi:phosphatidylglycerol lysyltransferase
LIWNFVEMCDRFDGSPVFYEVESKNLSLYIDIGLNLLKLGEEAHIPLKTFSLEGSAHKGFRHTLRKLENDGYIFDVVLPEEVSPLLPELKLISDIWLKDKNTREKRFSLGYFDENYLKRFPIGIVKKDGKIIAFANVWLGAEKEELSIDLMRHITEAPNGIMDYLFLKLFLWGKEEGFNYFNFGMAPLSGLEANVMGPLWNRVGNFVFKHGEHFYNFQGLRNYKNKFKPIWKPKYLAYQQNLELPRVFANLASLVSGSLKGAVSK